MRLTVCRCAVDDSGGWKEGISWDELMRLKDEAGFGDVACVELYPPNDDVVNVANLRHLWTLNEPPPWMWKKAKS